MMGVFEKAAGIRVKPDGVISGRVAGLCDFRQAGHVSPVRRTRSMEMPDADQQAAAKEYMDAAFDAALDDLCKLCMEAHNIEDPVEFAEKHRETVRKMASDIANGRVTRIMLERAIGEGA